MSSMLNEFLGPVLGPNRTLSRPVVFFDDFLTGCSEDGHKFSATADKGDWLISQEDANGTEPNVVDDYDGGAISMASHTSAGDIMQIQLNGRSFYCESGRRMLFMTKVKLTNTTQDAFIGLASDAHALNAGAYTTAPSDYIAFTLSGDADIEYGTAKSSSGHSLTDTGSDITAATWVDLAFEYDGMGKVYFYVNGSQVATTTTNVPEGKYLSPVFCVESNGAEETMAIDYVLVSNDRS